MSATYSGRMNKQNQIKSTLSQPESIELIQSHLERPGNTGRSVLSRNLCEHFRFFDPNGNLQVAGCLKALRELEKNGWFICELKLDSSSDGQRFEAGLIFSQQHRPSGTDVTNQTGFKKAVEGNVP